MGSVMLRRSSVASSRRSIDSGEVLPDDAEPFGSHTPLPEFVASLGQHAAVGLERVGLGARPWCGGDHAVIVLRYCEKRDGGWFQGVVRCPALLRLLERVCLLW
jgi:hypothetical protein